MASGQHVDVFVGGATNNGSRVAQVHWWIRLASVIQIALVTRHQLPRFPPAGSCSLKVYSFLYVYCDFPTAQFPSQV